MQFILHSTVSDQKNQLGNEGSDAKTCSYHFQAPEIN